MNKRNSDLHYRNPALTTGSLPLNNRKIHILWVEEGSIEGGGRELWYMWHTCYGSFLEKFCKIFFFTVFRVVVD